MLNLSSLNQRVNALTGALNNLVPPVPPTPQNLSSVLTNGNSAGTKDINMNNNDILLVDNINLTTINGSVYPPVVPADTLSAVLTAGNSATNLNVILNDGGFTSNTMTKTGLTATTGMFPFQRNVTISSFTDYLFGAENIQPVVPYSVASQTTFVSRDFIKNQSYIVNGADSINNVASLTYEGDLINNPFNSNPKLLLDKIGTGTIPNSKLEITPQLVQIVDSVHGTKSALWNDIIDNANTNYTYDEVLNAGNTATEKSAIITGAGVIGTTTSTIDKQHLSIQDTDGTGNQKSSSLLNNTLAFTSSVAFGYNDSLNISLDNNGGGGVSGISHLDNYATPSDFKIETDQNLLINAGVTKNIQMNATNLYFPPNSSPQYNWLNVNGLDIIDNTNLQFAKYYSGGLLCGNNTSTESGSFTRNGFNISKTALSASGVLQINNAGTNLILTGAGTSVATLASGTTSFSVLPSLTLTQGGSTTLIENTKSTLTSNLTGFTTNPQIVLNNTLATAGALVGVPSIETYKSGRNAVANDVISSEHHYAKNFAGTKTEFSKIEHIIRNTGVSNDDGQISFSCAINGVMTEFFNINGSDGDNNFARNVDINGQTLKSSSNNLNLSASSSTGAGSITLACKNGTGGLLLTGDQLLSTFTSGTSGQYLRLSIGGTFYKIKLEID